jgi:hypothetical protein
VVFSVLTPNDIEFELDEYVVIVASSDHGTFLQNNGLVIGSSFSSAITTMSFTATNSVPETDIGVWTFKITGSYQPGKFADLNTHQFTLLPQGKKFKKV